MSCSDDIAFECTPELSQKDVKHMVPASSVIQEAMSHKDPPHKGLTHKDQKHKGLPHKGLPIQSFETRAQWSRWLAGNGATSKGLWLKFYKKDSGHPTVSKAEAVEAALAHGWIDGQLDRFDETAWLVRFTPRTSTSKWSEINRKTAERLIKAGKMTAAGLAEVERARADGRWAAAYASQGTATVPDDLAAALDAAPKAKAFFATLNSVNRYAILYRTHGARKPETRKARIKKFVAMLIRGETIHPQKR